MNMHYEKGIRRVSVYIYLFTSRQREEPSLGKWAQHSEPSFPGAVSGPQLSPTVPTVHPAYCCPHSVKLLSSIKSFQSRCSKAWPTRSGLLECAKFTMSKRSYSRWSLGSESRDAGFKTEVACNFTLRLSSRIAGYFPILPTARKIHPSLPTEQHLWRYEDLIGWPGVNFSASCKTSQATATAWRQGGHPLIICSNCFEK